MRTTGRALSLLFVGGLFVAACGSSEKGGGAREPGGDDGTWEDTSQDDEDVGMIPPEKMDSIKATFDRKGRMVSRCLVDAMDAKEIKNNQRAVITITATISAQGKTTAVKVDEADPDSQVFADCVVGYVEKMEFTTLPRALDYSYTYAFDAL